MKHATAETLAVLSSLLAEVRRLDPLVERTTGTFYLKSRPFLHFHEDPSGIFADVKLDLATFTRVRITSPKEQAALLVQIRQCLPPMAARQPSKRRAGGRPHP